MATSRTSEAPQSGKAPTISEEEIAPAAEPLASDPRPRPSNDTTIPAVNATSTSLAARAPIEPIPEQLNLRKKFQQMNPCVRSQVGHYASHFSVQREGPLGIGAIESSTEETGEFPYPRYFEKMFQMRERVSQSGQWPTEAEGEAQEAEGVVASGVDEQEAVELGRESTQQQPDPEQQATISAREPRRLAGIFNAGFSSSRGTRPVGALDMPQEYRSEGEFVSLSTMRNLSIDTRWIGWTRKSEREVKTTKRPMYIVLGLFQRGHEHPSERVVFVMKPKQLFLRMRWAVFRLRGWSGTFLSLRHVNEFRLYRCDRVNGTHERVGDLDAHGRADLQMFVDTYRRWRVPEYRALAWADWVHRVLNADSQKVEEGVYSVEIVLDWSARRISVVILTPVLLSLAVGIWMNSADWSDLATIQTAWGTASYVVTAGGFVGVLLGIISTLVNK